MTYDYNAASPNGAPNAPIDWIEEQSSPPTRGAKLTFRITHFVGDKSPEARKKLLVGFNMYGTKFTPARTPITGKEYLELLSKHEPLFQWDAESEESFFEVTENGSDMEVWYPTLYSIK
jgi:spore germination protein YaaH